MKILHLILLPLLLAASLVTPASAYDGPLPNATILKDVKVSGVQVMLLRSLTVPSRYSAPCRARLFFDFIYVSGVINSDTSFIIGNMLKQIVETMPCSPRRETPPPMVFLNSTGGLVYDGFKIGEMLRWYGAQTSLMGVEAGGLLDAPHTCASSCAIAFLGGATRMSEGSLIFHAPYQYVGDTGMISCGGTKVSADLKKYYRNMIGQENGDRLFDRTMRYCSKDDGWIVNEDAALLYGITNRKRDR